MVSGVSGGLSARLGVDANLIRIAFVLLSVGAGTGFTLYVLAWLALPREGTDVPILRRVLDQPRILALGAAFGTALAAVLVCLAALGLGFAAGLLWPSLGVSGLVLVWEGADAEERAQLRELFGSQAQRTQALGGRRATVARVVVGVALVLLGLGYLSGFHRQVVATFESVVAAGSVLAGFALVLGPWWLRLVRELSEERRERVREQERLSMAAHVHDSVLQTLALIQRASADPREVTRLARAQERELRSWLFGGRAPGSFDASEVATVADAVAVVERDVETDHRVAVDSVVVGDAPLDEDLEALLAAGREATVNAAKWSGAGTVSLFVEIEPAQASLFVRDRGRGFDPEAVDGDRRGIAESIRARIARHGGTALIRSSPGEGTDVELVIPRKVPSR